jgi:gentisate 1,2-dioxygenase
VTGGYPLTTIAAFIQLMPRGFQTARYRSTDATIFVAVEGSGRTRIGADVVVEWRPRDIFVVPSWKSVTHEADDETVLFSFSDRPVQEALQLFREERRDA